MRINRRWRRRKKRETVRMYRKNGTITVSNESDDLSIAEVWRFNLKPTAILHINRNFVDADEQMFDGREDDE